MFSETYFSGLFKQNKRPLINRPPCYYLIPEWKCAHFYPIRCEQCSVSSPRFSVSAGHWCRLPACLELTHEVRQFERELFVHFVQSDVSDVLTLRSLEHVRFTRTCLFAYRVGHVRFSPSWLFVQSSFSRSSFICCITLPSRTCPIQLVLTHSVPFLGLAALRRNAISTGTAPNYLDALHVPVFVGIMSLYKNVYMKSLIN